MSCKILWDDSVQAYRVATPYNPNFVELLKQLIPIPDRVWDPSTKIWTVAEAFGDPIKKLCEQVYGVSAVTFVSKAQAAQIAAQRAAAAAAYNAQAQQQAGWGNSQYTYVPPKNPPQRGDPLDTVLLAFVKVLPYEAARAAYRKAAMELHPDKNNGDASRMTTLNTSWQRIETELYRKGGTL